MDKVNITIIGAGVIGLAIAKKLSEHYQDIIVLEKNEKYGLEISSRNSEVIHSGIYYKPGSLKAKLCVKGLKQLYEFCNEHYIPHKKTGKLIIAAEEEELQSLYELYEVGKQNNISNLQMIRKEELNKVESLAKGIEAIYSPETGIINVHSLMDKLYYFAEEKDVMFSFNSKVSNIEKNNEGYVISCENDDYQFCSNIVINCAGLNADKIAECAGIDIDKAGYRLKYCKGSYFSYQKKSPIKMLVYPLPQEHLTGLGIHSVIDTGGRLKFGPDTEYVTEIDYNVNESKKESFYKSVSKIINGLEMNSFYPDMAGIRPKLINEGFNDFIIKNEHEKNLEDFINLIGIESPGLTASLAIADYVLEVIK